VLFLYCFGGGGTWDTRISLGTLPLPRSWTSTCQCSSSSGMPQSLWRDKVSFRLRVRRGVSHGHDTFIPVCVVRILKESCLIESCPSHMYDRDCQWELVTTRVPNTPLFQFMHCQLSQPTLLNLKPECGNTAVVVVDGRVATQHKRASWGCESRHDEGKHRESRHDERMMNAWWTQASASWWTQASSDADNPFTLNLNPWSLVCKPSASLSTKL